MRRAGDGGMESVDPTAWYAVSTKPNQEKIARQNLERAGLESFCPMLRRNRIIRRRRETVVGPLFPGYIFARFDPRIQVRAVSFARGVRGVVRFGDQPAEVDEAIIASIRARMRDGCVALPAESLRAGQRVRIEEGPLRGMEAVFEQELPDQQRAALLLQALSFQARAVVDLDCVVPC